MQKGKWGNRSADKEKSTEKIEGVITIIMVFYRAIGRDNDRGL